MMQRMQRGVGTAAPSRARAGRRIAAAQPRRRCCRATAAASSSSSSSSARSSAAITTSTVDRLELLVPVAEDSPALPQAPQQQERRPQQQQQQQQQLQSSSTPPPPSDWLGRAPLAPDADPHTGGSEMDMVLMCLSLAILLFFSMEAYRLFAYVAFSPGFAAWRETFCGGGGGF